MGIAKAAAYSALLSFFPVLFSAATILVQAKADFASRAISAFLFEVVPPGTEDLVRYQFAVKGQRPTLVLITAALLSVWAASRVVTSLMDGFRAAYRIQERRSFWHEARVSVSLVFLAGLPLLAGLGLILFGEQVERLLLGWLVQPWWAPLALGWRVATRVAQYTVAFGVIASVTAMLYYYGPYRKQRWSAIWPGAVLSTVLCELATTGFAWYVRHLANYNLLYGSVATSIALLVWMYLIALIALLGCEFNAERERLSNSPIAGTLT